MKGWVYIITNKAMPNLLKVGFTTKDSELRAMELNNTGVPHPYKVEYDALVNNPNEIERKAHLILKDCHENKEWFKCNAAFAVIAIRLAADNLVLHEDNKSIPREEIKLAEIQFKQKADEYSQLADEFSDNEENFDKAIEMFQKALKIYDVLDDKENIALTYAKLCLLYEKSNNLNCLYFNEVIETGKKAVNLADFINDKEVLANTYSVVGWCSDVVGECKSNYAIDCYKKALPLYEELGNKEKIAINFYRAGVAYRGDGCLRETISLDESIKSFQKALQIFDVLMDTENMADSYRGLGKSYEMLNDMDKTIEYYKKSSETYDFLGDKKSLTYTCIELGCAYKNNNEPEKAIEILNKASQLCKEFNVDLYFDTEMTIYINLGELLENNDIINSVECYTKYLEISKSIEFSDFIFNKYKENIAYVYYRLGLLYMAQEQMNEAEYNFQQSIVLFHSIEESDYAKMVQCFLDDIIRV